MRRLKPATPAPPTGLPGELYDRLETTLLTCAPSDCAPIFVDDRISPWREMIPEAACSIDQARALIDMLFPRYNDAGDNALALFLIVLSERTNLADACHRRLFLLSTELNRLTHQLCPRSDRALHMARRVLDDLETQAAGYTILSLPTDLKIALEEKRAEVARLEGQQ